MLNTIIKSLSIVLLIVVIVVGVKSYFVLDQFKIITDKADDTLKNVNTLTLEAYKVLPSFSALDTMKAYFDSLPKGTGK